jgi:hypothetical protein
MNRSLLFVGLFLFGAHTVFAQQDFSTASNIISIDSPIKKEDEAKKSIVRLYPNPSYGKLSVTANTSSPLHFYIFDLEGTLIYQTVLKNKDRKVIDKLKKGTYLYDVFENDESIEEGKITIK